MDVQGSCFYLGINCVLLTSSVSFAPPSRGSLLARPHAGNSAGAPQAAHHAQGGQQGQLEGLDAGRRCRSDCRRLASRQEQLGDCRQGNVEPAQRVRRELEVVRAHQQDAAEGDGGEGGRRRWSVSTLFRFLRSPNGPDQFAGEQETPREPERTMTGMVRPSSPFPSSWRSSFSAGLRLTVVFACRSAPEAETVHLEAPLDCRRGRRVEERHRDGEADDEGYDPLFVPNSRWD